MSRYNFSQPSQQWTSGSFSTPNGGNRLEVNLCISDSCCSDSCYNEDEGKKISKDNKKEGNNNTIGKDKGKEAIEKDKGKEAIEKDNNNDQDDTPGTLTKAEAEKHNVTDKVGQYAFSSRYVAEELYPQMFSTSSLAKHLGADKDHYAAVNYLWTTTEPITYSWGTSSNMWCGGCEELLSDADPKGTLACEEAETKGVIFPAAFPGNVGYGKNFFGKGIPNIFVDPKKVEASEVIVKEFAPLILINTSGQMISREGKNTEKLYADLKNHLDYDGTAKECDEGDEECQGLVDAMEASQWSNPDGEAVLKISSTANADAYFM